MLQCTMCRKLLEIKDFAGLLKKITFPYGKERVKIEGRVVNVDWISNGINFQSCVVFDFPSLGFAAMSLSQ